MQYNQLSTELVNKDTENIDICSTEDIISLINNEDKKVAFEVEKSKAEIASAVDIIVDGLKKGGRLIYIGAGTSGRLGILDACECPPTYGTQPSLISCLMAGGNDAFFAAKENCEDNYELGESDIQASCICKNDIAIGISASGTAKYVIGALAASRKAGAKTICVCNVHNSELSKGCDAVIEVITGAEAITGSTRMKAGTAQKMVLNMLTTASMIKLGKVYKNLMVDLKANNLKLQERKIRIVMLAAKTTRELALSALQMCSQDTKCAITAILTGCDYKTALNALAQNDGFIRKAIELINSKA